MFSLDTKNQSNILSRFQDILLQISKNSHFELYYWMILKLQKFVKIRHFNIFTCGFRQKFTNLPNFHNKLLSLLYLSSLFVKVQKTQFFCDFWMILNFFGKTLVSVSYPYSKEPWGKQANFWRTCDEDFLTYWLVEFLIACLLEFLNAWFVDFLIAQLLELLNYWIFDI